MTSEDIVDFKSALWERVLDKVFLEALACEGDVTSAPDMCFALYALRDVFQCLAEGDQLETALRTPEDAIQFRVLLRCVKTVEQCVAELAVEYGPLQQHGFIVSH